HAGSDDVILLLHRILGLVHVDLGLAAEFFVGVRPEEVARLADRDLVPMSVRDAVTQAGIEPQSFDVLRVLWRGWLYHFEFWFLPFVRHRFLLYLAVNEPKGLRQLPTEQAVAHAHDVAAHDDQARNIFVDRYSGRERPVR